MAAAIAAGVTRMIRHDPGVRLGDDPEHVHQARVGTRRLRSDLRTFRSLLDGEWVTEMRTELGWAAAALGEVRDADVLTERMQARIATLPAADARPGAALLRRLATQRDAARARLLEVLNSDRYVALLDALSRAAADPPLLGPDDVDPSPSSRRARAHQRQRRGQRQRGRSGPLGSRSGAALDGAHRDGPLAARCAFERCHRHSRHGVPFSCCDRRGHRARGGCEPNGRLARSRRGPGPRPAIGPPVRSCPDWSGGRGGISAGGRGARASTPKTRPSTRCGSEPSACATRPRRRRRSSASRPSASRRPSPASRACSGT